MVLIMKKKRCFTIEFRKKTLKFELIVKMTDDKKFKDVYLIRK